MAEAVRQRRGSAGSHYSDAFAETAEAYECNECGECFETSEELDSHLQQEHELEPVSNS